MRNPRSVTSTGRERGHRRVSLRRYGKPLSKRLDDGLRLRELGSRHGELKKLVFSELLAKRGHQQRVRLLFSEFAFESHSRGTTYRRNRTVRQRV